MIQTTTVGSKLGNKIFWKCGWSHCRRTIRALPSQLMVARAGWGGKPNKGVLTLGIAPSRPIHTHEPRYHTYYSNDRSHYHPCLSKLAAPSLRAFLLLPRELARVLHARIGPNYHILTSIFNFLVIPNPLSTSSNKTK